MEQELEGRAEVLRVGVMSKVGARLAGRYGVRGVPALLVFDGVGQVAYIGAGIPDRETIEGVVTDLLGR